ncbi:MAG: cytidylate kinase family protein [Patescibacteria group bacterium]
MVDLKDIRNITISGRIGSGATTLAKKLSEELGWEMLDGGAIFRQLQKEQGFEINKSDSRPDHFDLEYEEMVKKNLKEKSHQIIQSHLAGYDSQGIEGVFKILVLCMDEDGEDKTEIRVDRIMNRDKVSVDEAKKEIKEREDEHLKKFRRLYADNDQSWNYWNKDYYDLVINTYSHNVDETLKIALQALGIGPN